MAGDDRPEEAVAGTALLGGSDPASATIINPQGRSPFLLIGDHAGNAIPEALGTLGLAPEDRVRHIAWDIGIWALGARLAERLDAVFVRQSYSRLVIDCNRDPASAEAIVERSDGTVVPGNLGLPAGARRERVRGIHAAYHQAIAEEIARRDAIGQPTWLVSLHSFTPEMAGVVRPWEVGVLHDGANDALALRLLAWLRGRPELIVGDNEPYRMDATDYTVPRHAFPSRPYVEIELSQHALSTPEGIERWTARLETAFREVGGEA
jgi:predicted N-formylglutamate amidohydrolase